MKNLRICVVFFIAFIALTNMLIAQDNVPKPVGEDETKPDTTKKEAKELYDLNLVFNAGMKFKEVASVNMDMNIEVGEESIEQSLLTEIGVNFEVLEIENNKLKKAKLVFDDIKAKAMTMGQEFDASQPGGFYGVVVFDKDGKMTFESTSDDFPEEIKTELESQNLIGYYPPTKGVAIGEEWVVDDKHMKAQLKKYSVDEVETKMKLEKVSVEGSNKIATLKMTVKFSGSDENSGLKMKGNAEGTVRVDITTHRILSRKMTMNLEGGADENGSSVKVTGIIKMDDSFKYEGQVQTRPAKDEDIAPKGDDDE